MRYEVKLQIYSKSKLSANSYKQLNEMCCLGHKRYCHDDQSNKSVTRDKTTYGTQLAEFAHAGADSPRSAVKAPNWCKSLS